MDGRKQGIQEYRNTVSKNRNRKGEIFHHTQRIQKKLSHVMFAEMKSNDIESIDGTYKLKKKHRTFLLMYQYQLLLFISLVRRGRD